MGRRSMSRRSNRRGRKSRKGKKGARSVVKTFTDHLMSAESLKVAAVVGIATHLSSTISSGADLTNTDKWKESIKAPTDVKNLAMAVGAAVLLDATLVTILKKILGYSGVYKSGKQIALPLLGLIEAVILSVGGGMKLFGT